MGLLYVNNQHMVAEGFPAAWEYVFVRQMKTFSCGLSAKDDASNEKSLRE